MGVVVCAALVAYARLYFSVSFNDEAYYVALASTFAKGRRFFIDELFLQQTGAFLTTPLASLYLSLFGTGGIVLFFRHLYFAASVGAALVVARRVRRDFSDELGLLAGGMVLATVPGGISSASYNTEASLGFLVGTLLVGDRCETRRDVWRYLAGLLALAAACVSYQLVAPGAVIAVGISLWSHAADRSPWTRSLALVTVAFALASLGVAAAFFLADGRVAALRNTVAFHASIGIYASGGWAKMKGFYLAARPHARFLLLATASLALVGTRRPLPPVARYAGATALLAAAIWQCASHYGMRSFPGLWLFLLGIVPVMALRRAALPDAYRRLVRAVWFPSLAAGAFLAWGSSGGLFVSVLGLLPACVAGMLLPTAWRPSREADRSLAVLFFGATVIAQVVSLPYQGYETAYRDLTARVDAGSFAGIRTTPAKKVFLAELETDLASLESRYRDVLFLDYFPAGYLLTRLAPLSPALFFLGPANVAGSDLGYRDFYARYFDGKGKLPDVVVRMTSVPGSDGEDVNVVYFDERDPALRKLFGSGLYASAIERPRYRIYVSTAAGEARRDVGAIMKK